MLPFERESPSTIADATRYFYQDHATMMAYFAVSPASDPCIIHLLDRDFIPSEFSVSPSLATEAFIAGAFGSGILKIDKTVATDTKTIYLRAETRGLIWVKKTI